MAMESDRTAIFPRLARQVYSGDLPQKILSVLIILVLFILILLPVFYVLYGSFQSGAPGTPGSIFTWANWVTAYTSPNYLRALGNTILLGLVVAILSLGIGGILAWIVVRTDAPWRNQMALLVIVPLMISNLITTLAWIALLAPNAGFINAWGRNHLGIRTLFDIYSFSGIVLVHVLHYSSFAFISLFAALRSIDSSLEEASYMLGANPWRTGLRMTLPLVLPTLSTTFLVIFVFVAENFSVPTLLGTPVGFQTLPSLIYYNMAVSPAQPNMAAAGGTMLLWIALLGTLFQRRLSGQASRYVTVGGKGGRHRIVALGPWRYAATAFVVLFLFLAVFLPYAVLVLGSFLNFLTPNIRPALFTLDNYRTLLSGDNLVAVRNSLVFSGLGGLGMAALYIAIGFIFDEKPAQLGPMGRICDDRSHRDSRAHSRHGIDLDIRRPTHSDLRDGFYPHPRLFFAFHRLRYAPRQERFEPSRRRSHRSRANWRSVAGSRIVGRFDSPSSDLPSCRFGRCFLFSYSWKSAQRSCFTRLTRGLCRRCFGTIWGRAPRHAPSPSPSLRRPLFSYCCLPRTESLARSEVHSNHRLREPLGMPLLQVDGLSKCFGSTRAVDDISFSVTSGEILVIVGGSGCGKTTTLRCIAGLEAPTAGTITLDGRVIASSREFVAPEARGIGMVFQSYALWPHMTVYQNIAYGLQRKAMEPEKASGSGGKHFETGWSRRLLRSLSIHLERRPAAACRSCAKRGRQAEASSSG